MANLNIGCNFTKEHVDAILKLRNLSKEYPSVHHFPNRITDVYGSPGDVNPLGSVRPTKREVHVEWKGFKQTNHTLREAGIKTNVTLNSLFPHYRHAAGLHLWSGATRETLATFLARCSLIGPMDYIIAHPALLDILHEKRVLPASSKITISTIMNVHSLAQLHWIKERWPRVKRVCPALWKNRDFKWLTQANAIIPLELLVNEFCTMGGVECEGLFRQACYLGQSMDVSAWSALDVCTAERKAHPEAWLKARFILPQWIPLYVKETGVKHYKVTGRTHPASFIYDVGLKYVQGEAKGNLLSLWGQLEATKLSDKDKQQAMQEETLSAVNIPIEELHYLERMIPNCSVGEKCGLTCLTCEMKWKEMQECLQ